MKRRDTTIQTPMAIVVAKTYLAKLGFTGFVNRNVTWDPKQVNLTPGQLALSVVLSTFTANRHPLSRIGQRFHGMDTELLFGKGVTSSDFSDDAIARTLDKIHEAGSAHLFSQLALSAFTTFDIPLGNLHADTSSHAFFGEYEGCEDPAYDGMDVTYGFSKEHRPDLKQIMIGNVVNSDGIPLVHQALNGNTADCTWNGQVIGTLSDLLGERLKDIVYIADAKLVTEPNLRLLHQKGLSFISRVPDNFCAKLASQAKKDAYAANAWTAFGSMAEDKKQAEYEGYSQVHYLGREPMRLLVVKSSAARDGFLTRLEKERSELARSTHEVERQNFACEPDALTAAEALRKKGSKGLFRLSYTLSDTTTWKRPPGNPGKNPKPPVEIVTWQVRFTITENTEAIQAAKEQAQSFVLVTNIPSDKLDDRELLWRYKKQHVVEAGFRWLRQPSMASAIFLKKPERIEALMMLIHVALMVRALMQQQARLRLGAMAEAPRIELNGQGLKSPTADKILVLLLNQGVITDRGERYYGTTSDKDFERVQVLMKLLGVTEDELQMEG